jgi:hypothetical protein
MTIDWDAGATLERATVEEHEPGQYVRTSTVAIWSGTLAGAIRQYLAKPDSQRFRYTILVGSEAGTAKTILDWRDIDELSQRADFPTS